ECPTTMNLRPDGSLAVTALPTKVKCPKCEKHTLLLKESKAGKKYVQCPDKKCNFISDSDEQGNPIKPPDTGIVCEKCGSPMVLRPSRFGKGYYLSCAKYPKCKGTAKVSPALQAKIDAAPSGGAAGG